MMADASCIDMGWRVQRGRPAPGTGERDINLVKTTPAEADAAEPVRADMHLLRANA